MTAGDIPAGFRNLGNLELIILLGNQLTGEGSCNLKISNEYNQAMFKTLLALTSNTAGGVDSINYIYHLRHELVVGNKYHPMSVQFRSSDGYVQFVHIGRESAMGLTYICDI